VHCESCVKGQRCYWSLLSAFMVSGVAAERKVGSIFSFRFLWEIAGGIRPSFMAISTGKEKIEIQK